LNTIPKLASTTFVYHILAANIKVQMCELE